MSDLRQRDIRLGRRLITPARRCQSAAKAKKSANAPRLGFNSNATTGLKAETVVAGIKDAATVGQEIEQRGGHIGVAEGGGPFAEAEIIGYVNALNLGTGEVHRPSPKA